MKNHKTASDRPQECQTSPKKIKIMDKKFKSLIKKNTQTQVIDHKKKSNHRLNNAGHRSKRCKSLTPEMEVIQKKSMSSTKQ